MQDVRRNLQDKYVKKFFMVRAYKNIYLRISVEKQI